VLEPLDLMARLAALVPPPRHVAMSWAKRLKRVFGIEIDTCQRCGGTLRIIASIEQPEIIGQILAHLERTAPSQPNQPERPLGARAPTRQARRL
jgi:Zn-finger nucleic acid-binding protein